MTLKPFIPKKRREKIYHNCRCTALISLLLVCFFSFDSVWFLFCYRVAFALPHHLLMKHNHINMGSSCVSILLFIFIWMPSKIFPEVFLNLLNIFTNSFCSCFFSSDRHYSSFYFKFNKAMLKRFSIYSKLIAIKKE